MSTQLKVRSSVARQAYKRSGGPMADSRTQRARTRTDKKRNAIREQIHA